VAIPLRPGYGILRAHQAVGRCPCSTLPDSAERHLTPKSTASWFGQATGTLSLLLYQVSFSVTFT